MIMYCKSVILGAIDSSFFTMIMMTMIMFNNDVNGGRYHDNVMLQAAMRRVNC